MSESTPLSATVLWAAAFVIKESCEGPNQVWRHALWSRFYARYIDVTTFVLMTAVLWL